MALHEQKEHGGDKRKAKDGTPHGLTGHTQQAEGKTTSPTEKEVTIHCQICMEHRILRENILLTYVCRRIS